MDEAKGGRGVTGFAIALMTLLIPWPARADEPHDPDAYIQVTASRVPEDAAPEPAAMTIITGAEMRERGATDLASALALVGGVSIAPGGDGGPASSVPEMWGLREFDAFLLVVDGVPWGGAYNPELAALSLENVERIEILRGAAPVMYGATSFTGVIQVIHEGAGRGDRAFRVAGGSYSSGIVAVQAPLPDAGKVKQSISGDIARFGFSNDRTEFGRGHLLYRLATPAGGGRFHLDVDVNALRQDPASPIPRVGATLTDLVPIDSNENPDDAHIDQDRFNVAGGYDRDFEGGSWSATLSLTSTTRDVLRGFLTDVVTTSPNAAGYTQDISVFDSYLDVHVALHPATTVSVVAGVDTLYGRADQKSVIYDYFIALDGSNPPDLEATPPVDEPEVNNHRSFSGLYGQCEWRPKPRLLMELGLRLNVTRETIEVPDEASDSDSTTRGSGVAGVSYKFMDKGGEGIWGFVDARNTFKPAAFDFGPDAEPEILAPETAISYEIGAKGRHGDGQWAWQVSAFQMDFQNLIVAQSVGGLPTLANAGAERFRGIDSEGSVRLPHDFVVRAAFSVHDARFQDYVQDFGGVPTQLDGNHLEMSARYLAATGVDWTPAHGWLAGVTANYVGSRWLNKRNTAMAGDYIAYGAGVGYRFAAGTVRVDVVNISDTRPPVSESELGDAQYYLLPARTIMAGWRQTF